MDPPPRAVFESPFLADMLKRTATDRREKNDRDKISKEREGVTSNCFGKTIRYLLKKNGAILV